jgi:hypothetical protein
MARISRREFLRIVAGTSVVVALGGAVLYFAGGSRKTNTSSSSSTSVSTSSNPSRSTTTTTSATTLGDKRYIRIRPLNDKSVWDLNLAGGAPQNWNAQQVLALISDLKPDVLQRYITGAQNPDALVPVASGSLPMTAKDFLQASVDANKSVLIPRISLDEYDAGTFFQTSMNLLNFPLEPPMRYLSLDNWHPFSSAHTKPQITGMFQQLYGQGWWEIGVNDAGGYFPDYGYAYWADVNTDLTTYLPRTDDLSQAQSETNLKRFFAIIDFPNTMRQFQALSPDTQADVLTSLASNQSNYNYTLLYNILQGF